MSAELSLYKGNGQMNWFWPVTVVVEDPDGASPDLIQLLQAQHWIQKFARVGTRQEMESAGLPVNILIFNSLQQALEKSRNDGSIQADVIFILENPEAVSYQPFNDFHFIFRDRINEGKVKGIFVLLWTDVHFRMNELFFHLSHNASLPDAVNRSTESILYYVNVYEHPALAEETRLTYTLKKVQAFIEQQGLSLRLLTELPPHLQAYVSLPPESFSYDHESDAASDITQVSEKTEALSREYPSFPDINISPGPSPKVANRGTRPYTPKVSGTDYFKKIINQADDDMNTYGSIFQRKIRLDNAAPI